MRFFSAISLFSAVILAVSPGADEDQPSPRVLWCQESEVIEIAECRDSPPSGTAGWLQVQQRGNCLGRPGELEETPQCNLFVLSSAEDGMPIERDCSIITRRDTETVRVDRLLRDGEALAPVWADSVTVSCAGFVDVSFAPTDPAHELELYPGRELVLTVFVPEQEVAEKEPTPENGRASLRNAEGEYGEQRELALREPLSFGKVPLGDYAIAVDAEGYAPVVDGFTLTPSDDPLELSYELPESRCLPVEVACNGCEGRSITFTLQRLSTGKPPVLYSEGALSLEAVRGSNSRGEICGLADGTYELALSAPSLVPVAQPVEVAPGSAPVFFELRDGVESRLYLVDADGLPVADADVRITWRAEGKPQTVQIGSDVSGEVHLPPLAPQASFEVAIYHDDCLPHRLSGVAGTERVVQLTPRGVISARIVGDACVPPVEVIATVFRRGGAGNQDARESYSSEDCTFDIPVKQPGAYGVVFHGPGFISHREELQLEDSLVADLGDIDLERGGSFRVKVLHQADPVVGATVRVGRDGFPLSTDDAGLAEFSCLEETEDGESSTELFVSHPSYAPRHLVQVVGPDDEVRVSLTAGAEIRGLVLSADGSPAVGETIYIAQPQGYAFTATVTGTGNYRFTRLEPGAWIVYRMKMFSSYGTVGMGIGTGDSRSVTLHDDESREVNFLPAIEVRGRVFIDGQLVDHATSMGAVQGGTAVSSAIPVHVDASGFYVARLPGPGVWTFFHGQLAFTTQVENCPCVVDILFTAAGAPATSTGG